jgi:poly(A) polymerase
MEPTILQRSEHTVSRKDISPAALKVLYRLHERGYRAYLAGGCVRDLLLGKRPKDFDVVTDATPPEVRRCFSHCRLIGRRFRLAHVIFGEEIIEVATFRANSSGEEIPEISAGEGEMPEPEESGESPVDDNRVHGESGMVLRDNVFGSPEEDAFRRDFTINALFYNIADFSIIDYVGGLADLDKRLVHAIGDPNVRYQEDPVRMIRALRFASTLGLEIEANTYEAILRQRGHLAHASHARMYEEVLKFFYSGAMDSAFDQWCETGLFDIMFPPVAAWVREQASDTEIDWLRTALQQMDKWRHRQVKASQELLYALFLAPCVRALAGAEALDNPEGQDPLLAALLQIQRDLAGRILIPKRILFQIYDLLKSQRLFEDRSSPERIHRFLRRSYCRDALAFYKTDMLARGENKAELISAWTRDLSRLPPPDPLARGLPARRPRRRRRAPRSQG